MEAAKSPELLALSVEHESAIKATEALVLSCQHEVQALEGKLQKVEGRSEEMEQVLKLKDGKIQELVDDAQNARREVVDKEQSLGVLEMKLANIQKAYDQDKEVSEAAMKALQKDQNSSLELVTECRDLRVQVANLSAEAFTEKHRAQSLEKDREVLQNQVKNLSASLTSERHGWLQEKHSVLAEKDAIQMALMSEQSTVKVLQQEQAEWHKKHQALLSEKNELIGNTMEQNEYWATKDREMKSELERMTRLRNGLQGDLEQRERRIEELQAVCSDLMDTIQEQKSKHDKFVEDTKLERSELDAELADYKNIVDSLDLAYIPTSSSNPLRSEVSPDIVPIDDITKAELHRKYAELFEACKRGQEDLKRRTEYVHHLTNEKKANTAYIAELKAKFILQSQEFADLEAQIQSLESSKKSDLERIANLQDSNEKYKKKLEAVDACKEDLGAKVSYLLKENMRIKRFHTPYQRQRGLIEEKNTDARRGTSRKGGEIGDIDGLVKQNMDLQSTLQSALAACEEKEASWRLKMEDQSKQLAEYYKDALDDLARNLEDTNRQLEIAEREKGIYFNLMLKDNPGNARSLPDLTSVLHPQVSITSFQEQIHDLEIKLKESEKAACHVTLLEARVERIQNELSEAHKQLLDKQVAQESSWKFSQGIEEKVEVLRRNLEESKVQLASQKEATRSAQLSSRDWKLKAEELQGWTMDLSSQISVLVAEKKNSLESRDAALAELERITSERTALAAKLEVLESKNKTGSLEPETEGSPVQGEVQSSVNVALAKISEDIQSMVQQRAYHKTLEDEKLRLESTVQDLESKGVHLASEATTLKSTLERKETQIAEMQKMIDLQNETPGASAESARKLFTLRQQLTASQEECARHKATAEQMQIVAKENDINLRDAKEVVKDKEEQLESVKAEMLTYKKKLTTLAKTMKAPMDERRNLELEIATAKAQASSANESKEKAEQSLQAMTVELEKAQKLVTELENTVSQIQNEKQVCEEEAAAQQMLGASYRQEIEKLQADLLTMEQQVQDVERKHNETVTDISGNVESLKEVQKATEIRCSTLELEHKQTLQKLVEKEKEIEQLQQATDNASQVPFDVQQELERLRMFESVHQEDIITIKGENEGLKLETRSLAEENQSLHSQLTGLQGEIQDLKTRTEKLAAGRVAESNGLRNNIARQQRIIDQKDGIIAKLKLELSKSITKEDHSLEKHGPGGAAHMQSSVLFPADGLTSLTDSGQLSQYRQRVVERMQEIKPNIAATSQLHSQQPKEIVPIPAEAGTTLTTSTGALLDGTESSVFAQEAQIGPSSTKRSREEMETIDDIGGAQLEEDSDKKIKLSNTEPLVAAPVGGAPSSPAINFGPEEDIMDVVDIVGASGSESGFEGGLERTGEEEDHLSTEPEEGEYGVSESPTTSKDAKEDDAHIDTQSRPAPGTAFANRRRSGRLLAEEVIVTRGNDDSSQPRHTPIVFRPGRSKRISGRGRGRGRATKDAEGESPQE